MVRDPFEKNKSQFFQDLPYWMSYRSLHMKTGTRSEGMDYVYDTFTHAFNHELVLNWFDDEFRRFTSINIFEEPFDRKAGYTVIKKGRFEIFLYKLEVVNDMLPIVCEFCGLDIDLKYTNRGDKKWHAEVYKDFKKNYEPTRER